MKYSWHGDTKLAVSESTRAVVAEIFWRQSNKFCKKLSFLAMLITLLEIDFQSKTKGTFSCSISFCLLKKIVKEAKQAETCRNPDNVTAHALNLKASPVAYFCTLYTDSV